MEKPKELREKRHITYWASKEGVLYGGQKTKALKFVELGLVQPIVGDVYVVKKIDGYNKTDYKVVMPNSCECQFNKKTGKECSHIMAVNLFRFINNWKGGELE